MKLDDHRRIGVRLLSLVVLVAVTAVLTACGGESAPPPAPGSPAKPLVGQQTPASPHASRLNEAGRQAGTVKPGYQALVKRQSRKPTNRFSPCNLVSQAQAKAIVGQPIQDLVEAPQGPTCIYRPKNEKAGYITLAVQSTPFSAIKRQIRKAHTVDVSNRTAYCGSYGQPMLYVPISSGRVLSIAAPCAVAKKFAITAVRRLND
jgi:hypothetical protein